MLYIPIVYKKELVIYGCISFHEQKQSIRLIKSYYLKHVNMIEAIKVKHCNSETQKRTERRFGGSNYQLSQDHMPENLRILGISKHNLQNR